MNVFLQKKYSLTLNSLMDKNILYYPIIYLIRPIFAYLWEWQN